MTWLRKQLETADVDLLREMVRTFAETLMSAEVDAVCGAPYGERSEERVNQRNDYRIPVTLAANALATQALSGPARD